MKQNEKKESEMKENKMKQNNMTEYKMTQAESEMAELIWRMEPMTSAELVKQCEQEFSWKKSTTYTMLKRLEEKELFHNEGGTVVSLVTKEEYDQGTCRQFVEKNFAGSLPKFIAAFTGNSKLSAKELDELMKMIDSYQERK